MPEPLNYEPDWLPPEPSRWAGAAVGAAWGAAAMFAAFAAVMTHIGDPRVALFPLAWHAYPLGAAATAAATFLQYPVYGAAVGASRGFRWVTFAALVVVHGVAVGTAG